MLNENMIEKFFGPDFYANAIVGGKRKEIWKRSKKFQRKCPSLRRSWYGVIAHPNAPFPVSAGVGSAIA